MNSAKPATAYQGLTGPVQNLRREPASPHDLVSWTHLKGGFVTIGEAIKLLEKNGYKVLPANRVETIYAEYDVDGFAREKGGPDFATYLANYSRSYLAHTIGQVCEPKMAVLELPLDKIRYAYPLRSEVDVFIPTKEELERRYTDRLRGLAVSSLVPR